METLVVNRQPRCPDAKRTLAAMELRILRVFAVEAAPRMEYIPDKGTTSALTFPVGWPNIRLGAQLIFVGEH
jgi:hypothetical protein